jgi:hypothetical protein
MECLTLSGSTFIKSGVTDFVVDSWVGFLTPVRTIETIVRHRITELIAALHDQVVHKRRHVIAIKVSSSSAETQSGVVWRAMNWWSGLPASGLKEG